MATKLEDFIAKLPTDAQQRIAARTAEILAEESTLRQLREARRQSQTEVAERLKTTQAAISRLEKRTDVYLSTLRKYVEAMGGSLEILATFPDKPPVKLTQFHD
jgi:predicted transcriptional regulator